MPGETIGSAALEPNHQLGGRHRFALVVAHVSQQVVHHGQGLFDFVAFALGVEEANAFLVDLTEMLAEHRDVVVLATEAEHQHTAGVGMLDQATEELLGHRLIDAELRAAVRMREREDPIVGRPRRSGAGPRRRCVRRSC